MPTRAARRSQPVILASADQLKRLAYLQEQWRLVEAERLANLDVFAEIGYAPTPKQREFHEATEYDVLYGGAAGGGKSVALVAHGLWGCAKYAGLRTLLIRRTFDELEESIFPALRKFDYGRAVGGKWNEGKHELKFSNGSLFRFRYMETLGDATRRQGGEYQLLLVDELTLMTPGVVDLLRYDRIRASTGVPVLGVRCSSNPGGPGHGQVKTRYIESTNHGQRVVTDEFGLTIRFIQAKSTDNPHLDDGYQNRLSAIPDPARRAAMRDGDWDQFAGQMFKEFRRHKHVIDPFAPPATWRRYNGIDWGFRAPWAVLWAAVDEDGRVWFYREIYKTQVGEADQAKMILAAEEPGEHIVARYADDAMWAARGDAKPIAEVYADNDVALTEAGSQRIGRVTGWQRWHTYLKDGPACSMHRAQGLAECPMVHISSSCENLITELSSLPHAQKGNPEDSDENAIDHAMDASRYLLTNLGTGPEFVIFSDTAQAESILDEAGIEVMQQVGKVAVRPDEEGSPWLSYDDEDDPDAALRGTVQPGFM